MKRTRTREEQEDQLTVNRGLMDDLPMERLQLDDIYDAEYNPRKLSRAARKQIGESLDKFSLVDPLIVNRRKNGKLVLVGGHQRKTLLKEKGVTSAQCVVLTLSLKDEKELNLRLNKNNAEWDMDILKAEFDLDMLTAVGFEESEIGSISDEYEKEVMKHDNSNCEMPIVPKFSESYGVLTIYYKNDLDENWLRNALGLEKKKDYKSNRIKEAWVMDVKELQKKWESRPAAGGEVKDDFAEEDEFSSEKPPYDEEYSDEYLQEKASPRKRKRDR